MSEQLTLGEIIGNVDTYVPIVVEEVEAKEMIGKFPGKITKSELKTGTTNGREWASVNCTLECTAEGLESRLAFINIFLGKEPPMYGTPEEKSKSQTENFLDKLETAKLIFEDKSESGFLMSVNKLVGQECWFKSKQKKKKSEEGKYVPQVNDAGYKVLVQTLIAPVVDKEESKTGSRYT